MLLRSGTLFACGQIESRLPFLPHAVQQLSYGQEPYHQQANQALGPHEGAVDGEGVDEGGHTLRGVGAEKDEAGDKVAEKASGKAEENSQVDVF